VLVLVLMRAAALRPRPRRPRYGARPRLTPANTDIFDVRKLSVCLSRACLGKLPFS
jgi:hypothetical protein